MNINNHTKCFNGRVNGMSYQLRITPFEVRPKPSCLPKSTEAEIFVFDANGNIVDSFERAFHHLYDWQFIKGRMREGAMDRVNIPGLKEQA